MSRTGVSDYRWRPVERGNFGPIEMLLAGMGKAIAELYRMSRAAAKAPPKGRARLGHRSTRVDSFSTGQSQREWEASERSMACMVSPS